MGHSTYSSSAADHLYKDVRSTLHPSAVFTSDTVAPTLDPMNVKVDPKGVKVRESRDSKEHPESNAIAIFFDVTGSMGGVPKRFAMSDKGGLGALMRHLTTHNYIPHPQVFMGAIGDATCDRSPLQVGEFESGLEMDEHLTKIHLESGGGGGTRESYELALYFAARHMAMDCLEKRGKKGYLFLIGDEMPYDKVHKTHVASLIGDNIQQDISIEDIIAEAQEKFEVFFIFCDIQSYPPNVVEDIKAKWKSLMGERMLILKDPEHVCELIGITIGANESGDLDAAYHDLIKTGTTKDAADAAKNALVPFLSATGSALRKGSVSGSLDKPAGTGKSERL